LAKRGDKTCGEEDLGERNIKWAHRELMKKLPG